MELSSPPYLAWGCRIALSRSSLMPGLLIFLPLLKSDRSDWQHRKPLFFFLISVFCIYPYYFFCLKKVFFLTLSGNPDSLRPADAPPWIGRRDLLGLANSCPSSWKFQLFRLSDAIGIRPLLRYVFAWGELFPLYTVSKLVCKPQEHIQLIDTSKTDFSF